MRAACTACTALHDVQLNAVNARKGELEHLINLEKEWVEEKVSMSMWSCIWSHTAACDYVTVEILVFIGTLSVTSP